MFSSKSARNAASLRKSPYAILRTPGIGRAGSRTVSASTNIGLVIERERAALRRKLMLLDPATLFTVATSITGLLGVFLLVLWLQERSMRAMAWWGGAYVMGACAVTLWGAQGQTIGSYRADAGDAERVPVRRLRHDLERRAAVSRPRGAAAARCSRAQRMWFDRHAVPEFADSDQARMIAVVDRDRALRVPHRVRVAARAPARIGGTLVLDRDSAAAQRGVSVAGRADPAVPGAIAAGRPVRAVCLRDGDLRGRHRLRRRGDGEGARRAGAQDRGDDRSAHRPVQPPRLPAKRPIR